LIKNGLLLLVSSYLLTSCGWLKAPEEGIVVARVNDAYLYQSDLEDYLEDFSTDQDSLILVSNFINKWATKQLLLDGARRNVSRDDPYKDALVNKQLDTVVTAAEAQMFYEENKQNFSLNEDLLKLRYIQIGEDYNNKKQLQEFFIRFNQQDKYILDSLKFQFKKYFLNDSVWVKKSVVIQSMNPVNTVNADNLLKKTNFVQLRDSLGLYLISVGETLSRKQTAPIEYVRPTIDQILKNKRKLALVKELEKEIKDDAIKNNKFEIYN